MKPLFRLMFLLLAFLATQLVAVELQAKPVSEKGKFIYEEVGDAGTQALLVAPANLMCSKSADLQIQDATQAHNFFYKETLKTNDHIPFHNGLQNWQISWLS